jgi:tRNA(Ile)-lysidine synthase
MDLVARLNLAVVKDVLIVKTWGADLPEWGMALLPSDDYTGALDVGGRVKLSHGWLLTAEAVQTPAGEVLDQLHSVGAGEAWLDLEKLCLPLTVRGRRPGERWQPLGMGGHTQSLQDFFINQKVPEHLRDRWPLVCSGEQVAWAVGLRPSEAFKLTGDTQRIVRLALLQEDD